MKKLILIISLVALSTTGCASVGTYFRDRGNDLADCAMVRIGVGYGLNGLLRVTKIGPTVYLGLGEHEYYGFMGRNWYVTTETTGGLGLVGAHRVVSDKKHLTYYQPPDKWFRINDCNILAVPGHVLTSYSPSRPIDLGAGAWWIEATLGCFVGVNVGINPYEIADFVMGLFTVDFACDDRESLIRYWQANYKKDKEFLDFERRENIAMAMAGVQDSRAIEMLVYMLENDSTISVRRAAVDSLAETWGIVAVEALYRAHKNTKDVIVNNKAVKALYQINGEDDAKMLIDALLTSENQGFRRFAARKLGYLGYISALKPLEKVIKETNDEKLREACRNAVTKILKANGRDPSIIILDDE